LAANALSREEAEGQNEKCRMKNVDMAGKMLVPKIEAMGSEVSRASFIVN
jgi:hypothetical protein